MPDSTDSKQIKRTLIVSCMQDFFHLLIQDLEVILWFFPEAQSSGTHDPFCDEKQKKLVKILELGKFLPWHLENLQNKAFFWRSKKVKLTLGWTHTLIYNSSSLPQKKNRTIKCKPCVAKIFCNQPLLVICSRVSHSLPLSKWLRRTALKN